MYPWEDGAFHPRSVLVLDNCYSHYNLAFHRILADAGVRVIFLPPYSPQFNPIEEAFAQYKKFLNRHLRSVIRAGYSDLDAIAAAFDSILPSDCAGYVRNARYDTTV